MSTFSQQSLRCRALTLLLNEVREAESCHVGDKWAGIVGGGAWIHGNGSQGKPDSPGSGEEAELS